MDSQNRVMPEALEKQTFVCFGLSEADYAQTFSTYLKASSEHEKMKDLIGPVLNEFQGKHIDVMSIGAGDGSFEDALIKQQSLMLKYFHGIEPDGHRRPTLQDIVSTWNTEHFIDERYFDENFETDKKFDLIIIAHVLYHVKQPIEAILKAKSFLASNGKLIIFLDTRKGSIELVSKLKPNFEASVQRLGHPWSLTIEDLSENLDKLGQSHKLTKEMTHADVTEFIQKQETDTANDVISFLTQTRFDKMPKDLQKDIYDMVEERCVQKDGRFLFQLPVGMIELKQL